MLLYTCTIILRWKFVVSLYVVSIGLLCDPSCVDSLIDVLHNYAMCLLVFTIKITIDTYFIIRHFHNIVHLLQPSYVFILWHYYVLSVTPSSQTLVLAAVAGRQWAAVLLHSIYNNNNNNKPICNAPDASVVYVQPWCSEQQHSIFDNFASKVISSVK